MSKSIKSMSELCSHELIQEQANVDALNKGFRVNFDYFLIKRDAEKWHEVWGGYGRPRLDSLHMAVFVRKSQGELVK